MRGHRLRQSQCLRNKRNGRKSVVCGGELKEDEPDEDCPGEEKTTIAKMGSRLTSLVRQKGRQTFVIQVIWRLPSF